jgi:YD repeat-containing protein
MNRVTGTIDPLGDRTTYTYDTHGLLRTVTDPLGQVTTQAYDACNRLCTVTDPLGQVTTYGYDAASRSSGDTIRKGQSSGDTEFRGHHT